MTAAVANSVVERDVESVYRTDGDKLWRALYAFAGDEDVAYDAAAEAFAQALRRGEAIRDVRAWVWRTAFRLAAGDLYSRGRVRGGQVPERAVYDTQLDDELAAALNALTPQQRLVLVLYYYADLPVAEVSRRSGINALAVRAHLSRGRRRLRELLGDDE
jgi:RNA polymerase sigma-70 factor (ECF subfamily)